MSAFTLRMSIGAPTHQPLSRREVAEQIEAMINLLDRFEDDPDLEEDGNTEPGLGWAHCEAGYGAYRSSRDDREEDVGDEGEMDDDREWSLGSLGNDDQRAWSGGAGHDLEDGAA